MTGALRCLLLATAVPALGLERFEAVEPAMGTLFRVTVYAESAAQARTGFDAAFARARELDAKLSDYREDSELNRLCRAGRARASDDLLAVLAVAVDVARSSRGAFDPTVGPFTRLWRESRRTGRLPSPAALADARRRTGWKNLRLDLRTRVISLAVPGMQLDLGGIAKGFAADEMLERLRALGLPHALVAASGDLALGDPPPGLPGWTIGLGETSLPPRLLANQGLSTSGPAEQFAEIDGRRYSHIVNPRTGIGLVNASSVTLIAPTATLADALATAISVLGPVEGDRLARRWKAVCLMGKEVERK